MPAAMAEIKTPDSDDVKREEDLVSSQPWVWLPSTVIRKDRGKAIVIWVFLVAAFLAYPVALQQCPWARVAQKATKTKRSSSGEDRDTTSALQSNIYVVKDQQDVLSSNLHMGTTEQYYTEAPALNSLSLALCGQTSTSMPNWRVRPTNYHTIEDWIPNIILMRLC